MDARTDKSCFCNPTQQLHITLIFISNLHKLLSKMIHPNFFPGFAKLRIRWENKRERVTQSGQDLIDSRSTAAAASSRCTSITPRWQCCRTTTSSGLQTRPPNSPQHPRTKCFRSSFALLYYWPDPSANGFLHGHETYAMFNKGCLVLTWRFGTFKRRDVVENFWCYR